MSKQHIYSIENDIIDPSLNVIGNICEEVGANKTHVMNLMMSKYRKKVRDGLKMNGGFMNWEMILFACLIVVGCYGLFLIWKEHGVKRDEYSISLRLEAVESFIKKHEMNISGMPQSFKLIADEMAEMENFKSDMRKALEESDKNTHKGRESLKSEIETMIDFNRQKDEFKFSALDHRIRAIPREMSLKIDGEIPMHIGELEVLTKIKRNKKGEILRYGIIRPRAHKSIREAKEKMVEAGL